MSFGYRPPGYPLRINPPFGDGQWWHLDNKLCAVYVVCAGDGCHSVRPLTKEWLNEELTHIPDQPGDLLWSAHVMPRVPEPQPHNEPGYEYPRQMCFAIGQVRMWPDGRVFFVTPAEDTTQVVIRAAFDLQREIGLSYTKDWALRECPIVYDPEIDHTLEDAARCRTAWELIRRNAAA